PVDPEDLPAAHYRLVSEDYFRTMRIPVVRGRMFATRDDQRSSPVVIINETLAARHFPSEDPVGRHVLIDDNNTGPRSLEIVGVVADTRHQGLDGGSVVDTYLPYRQVHPDGAVWLANNQFWVLRTAKQPETLANALRRTMAEVDADVATSNVRSMEAYLADSVGLRRFNLLLVAVFAGRALVAPRAG